MSFMNNKGRLTGLRHVPHMRVCISGVDRDGNPVSEELVPGKTSKHTYRGFDARLPSATDKPLFGTGRTPSGRSVVISGVDRASGIIDFTEVLNKEIEGLKRSIVSYDFRVTLPREEHLHREWVFDKRPHPDWDESEKICLQQVRRELQREPAATLERKESGFGLCCGDPGDLRVETEVFGTIKVILECQHKGGQ